MELNELENMIGKGELSHTNRFKWLALLIEQDPEFEDIINRLVGYLKLQIPELKNLSEYSVMMAHLKVIAFIYYEFISLELRQMKKNMFLDTANEEYLIRYGNEFGIKRKTIYEIRGQVWIGKRSLPRSNVTIPPGTKIFLGDKAYIFYTTDEVILNRNIKATSEGFYTVPVKVISYDYIKEGEDKTSKLLSYHDEIDICHNLTIEEKLVKVESFDQFRQRLLRYSQGLPVYSELAMKSRLENISIVRYVHMMPRRIPGKISFYIEFMDHKREVKQKIDQVRFICFEQMSLAYDFHIIPVKLVPLDLQFRITSRAHFDRNKYEVEMKEKVEEFLCHYDPKVSYLNIVTILQFFYRDEKIENVEMIYPLIESRILKSDLALRYYLNELKIEWLESQVILEPQKEEAQNGD